MAFISFQDNVSELRAIMNYNIGIMSYLFRYWRGTYPLLLIEVQSKDSSVEDVSRYSATDYTEGTAVRSYRAP